MAGPCPSRISVGCCSGPWRPPTWWACANCSAPSRAWASPRAGGWTRSVPRPSRMRAKGVPHFETRIWVSLKPWFWTVGLSALAAKLLRTPGNPLFRGKAVKRNSHPLRNNAQKEVRSSASCQGGTSVSVNAERNLFVPMVCLLLSWLGFGGLP